jgi:hypothetical protein
MEIDIAGVLSKLRMLEFEHGIQRCPEREATRLAIKYLASHKHVDKIMFGMTMASQGFMPRDKKGAINTVIQSVGNMVTRRKSNEPIQVTADSNRTQTSAKATPRPFFAGCALRQDAECYELTQQVAAALGIPILEADNASCCGHPTRGVKGPPLSDTQGAFTVCPGCESSLHDAGIETKPLWEALIDQASRNGGRLTAIASHFVPYVGCIGDRHRHLDSLANAARLAGIKAHTAYPSLHASCCGALGSMYRGETKATLRLLDFAIERGAPIVTTCLLCRGNLRSAARRQHMPVKIYFWPQFFQIAPITAPAL